MKERALLHIPDSNYCFPVNNNEIVIRLRMADNEKIENVELVYESKYTIYSGQKTQVMALKYRDRLFKYYEAKLTLTDVRLAYVFRITQNDKTYYYSEDGLTKTYDFQLSYYNFFQMPYLNEADLHPMVSWMDEAVFYQIFVDRFYKGSKTKDESYINMKWGDKPKSARSFAGGDIPGITKKLDYIKDLGVNAIYLTPIFQSVSNHKYDISDYKTIDPQFGTKAEFKELVTKIHQKGMRIVLDAVFNHCSMYSPQFQDVLEKGKKSKYFDWFVIHGDQADPDNLNYEVFAFCEYMPKWNTSNVEVQKFLLDIALYWIREYDIDGWRLDVSDEVSHDFWRKFRHAVKQEKPDCLIVGENWHNANPYLRGDQYDGIMNYAYTKACLDYFVFKKFNAKQYAEKLASLLMRNTDQVNHMMLNLLDSHDVDRFITYVHKNKNKLLSALAITMLYVGAPCIYYGTEICLEGGYDPDNRRCFDWEESHWDKQFMTMLKQLIRFRSKKVIQKGEIKLGSFENAFVMKRSYESTTITLFVNISKQPVEIQEKGEILLENQYCDHKLGTDGFVIMQTEGE